jgi:hypothetical protein
VVKVLAGFLTTETQRAQRSHRGGLQVTSLHICSYPYEQGDAAVNEIRYLPLPEIHQLPLILKQLELKLILFVDLELASRREKPGVLFLIRRKNDLHT